MRHMWILSNILSSLLMCHFVYTHMLKINECNLYDAEFSVFKRDYRFKNNITKQQQVLKLFQCVHGCTVYPHCYAINFNRKNLTCQFVNKTTNEFTVSMNELEKNEGWTYYETKDKRALGPSCDRDNPCNQDERCEDRCIGFECVSLFPHLSLKDFDAPNGNAVEQSGVIEIGQGHYIQSKRLYNRPFTVEAEMRTNSTSECIAMTLFAASTSHDTEISIILGAFVDKWKFNPGGNQGFLGSITTFWKIKLELDANTEVKFYINDELKHTAHSHLNNGFLRFLAACRPAAIRNVRIR